MLSKPQVKVEIPKWRAPDKPVRLNHDQLYKFDNGLYTAQPKKDGFRLEVITDSAGHVSKAVSRSNKDLPVSPEVMEDLKALNLPPMSQLDAEWMKRRAGSIEKVCLFDVLYWDGRWVGSMKHIDRVKILDRVNASGSVEILETREDGFLEFFGEQIGDDESEGIVLKHKTMRMIGNRGESKKNPKCFKIKWRDGVDGQTVVCTKEDWSKLMEEYSHGSR